MRRMKIRATPNIGGGGGSQRSNQSRNKPPDPGLTKQSSSGLTGSVIGSSLIKSTTSETSLSSTAAVPEITVGNIAEDVKIPIVNVPDSPKGKLPGVRVGNDADNSEIVEIKCIKDNIPSSSSQTAGEFISGKRSPQLSGVDSDAHEPKSQRNSRIPEVLQAAEIADSRQTSDYSVKSPKLVVPPRVGGTADTSSSGDQVVTIDELESDPCTSVSGELSDLRPSAKMSSDNVTEIQVKDKTESKDVIIEEDKRNPKIFPPPGTVMRRMKIRAKPSLFGIVGKKTSSKIKEEASAPVIPVTDLETEGLQAEDKAKTSEQSDDIAVSFVKSPQGQNKFSLDEAKDKDLKIGESSSSNQDIKEIVLKDDINKPKTPVGKVQHSEVNIRRPKIRAKPTLFSPVARKGLNPVKEESQKSKSPTEIVLDEGDNSLTSAAAAASFEKSSDKSAASVNLEEPLETSVASVDVGKSLKPSVDSVTEKTLSGTSSNVKKEEKSFETSGWNKEGEFSKTTLSASGAEKSSEITSVKPLGSTIRRRKIQAKPSFLSAAAATGRNAVSSIIESKVIDIESEQDEKNILNAGTDKNSSFKSKTGHVSASVVPEEIIVDKSTKSVEIDEAVHPVEHIRQLPLIPGEKSRPPKIEHSSSPRKESVINLDEEKSEILITDSKPDVNLIKDESEGQRTGSKPDIIPSTAVNNTRRSKIRARPTLFSKRKVSSVQPKEELNDKSMENNMANIAKDQEEARLLSEKIAKEKLNEESHLDTLSENSVESEMKVEAKGVLGSLNASSVNSKKRAYDGEDSLLNTKTQKSQVNHHSKTKPDLLESVNTDETVPLQSRARKSQVSQRSRAKPDLLDAANSDDSGGDKENASDRLASGKVTKRERTSKESGKPLMQSRAKPKISQDVQINPKGKLKLKKELEEDSETKQKKIFRERKEKFRKKLNQSQGNIERGEMTMFDLIFWNPANNPMPGRTEVPQKKEGSSHGDSVNDAASDILEEQMVDDLGLDGKNDVEEVQPKSPSTEKEVEVCEEVSSPKSAVMDSTGETKEDDKEEKENFDDDNNDESAVDIFAPQVKIGPNGQIILDEQSIKIQTTAAKNRDEILSKAEVVEESNDSAHYGKWSKKRRRSCEWTMKETARFYKALSTVGTDFSLMETLFTWRSRAELKTKFKKEERTNRDLVDRALKDCTQFDFTPFDDESDYDPEEDRKAARIAERAEAKRKRLEMKQSQKREEKQKKKMLLKAKKEEIKERKVLLRKMRDKMKRKEKKVKKTTPDQNVEEDDLGLDLSDSDVEFVVSSKSVQQDIQKNVEAVKVPRKRRIKKKESKKKKSSSTLEISEVTVTMEMVKYDLDQPTVPVTETTIQEVTICEDMSELPYTQDLSELPSDDIRQVLPSIQCDKTMDTKQGLTSDQCNKSSDTTQVLSSDQCHESIDSRQILPSNESDESIDSKNVLPSDPCNEPSNINQVSSSSHSDENVNSRHSLDSSVLLTDQPPKTVPDESSVSEILGMPKLPQADEIAGSSKVTVSSEPAEDEGEINLGAEGSHSMWQFPLSAIKVAEDGTQNIGIPTATGEKLVPVPHLPPGTSNILVVASKSAENPDEYIYHVYTVSPASE